MVMLSKLSPPVPPAAWLARDFGEPGPVTALVAGPGHGKTLALLALSARAPMRIWYGLGPEDADVATFFHHLVAGMRAHIPDFGDEVLALVSASKLEAKRLWQRFFQAVAAYNLPGLAVVLDDAHHLAGTDLLALPAKLPPGVQVLLASRTRLARIPAWGPERLRFRPAEVEAFLRGHQDPIPEEWRRQAAAAEGWPQGLSWIVAGAHQAVDLFAAQPPGRQAFMLRAALLQEPSAEALAHLMPGADHLDALEGEQLITRLARASHGARPGMAPEVRYRFPAYILDFLREEARRVLLADELAELHRRAGAYYQARELDELALPHLIAAGAWPEAVTACTRSFPTMSTYGRKAAVQRVIAGFPPEVVAREPYLRLWQGNALVRAFDLEGAAAAYEDARRLYRERGEGDLKALVRALNVAIWTGADVAPLKADAEHLLAGGAPEDVADYHLSLALLAEGEGDPRGMRAHNEAVLAVPEGEDVEVASCRAIALINLTTWGLQHGDLKFAEASVQEAQAVAERWRFYGSMRTATVMRAMLHLVQGQAEGVALLQQLPPFWEDALNFIELGVAYTVQAYAFQAQGEPRAAEEVLRKAIDLFAKAGYLDARKIPLERLLWVALQRGQADRVEPLIAELAPEPGTSLHDWALQVPRARARHGSREAVELLEAAVAGFDGLEAHLEATRARLYLAAARKAVGDPPGTALAEADAAIAARGYGFLREQDASLWEELRATPASGLLAIKCLGPMEVRKDGVLLDTWPRRKSKIVLAALALQRGGVAAKALAEVVAQEEVSMATMHSLQMTVSALRKVLGAADYVTLADDRYQLALLEGLDLDAFDAAYQEGLALRQARPFEAAEAFERALAHTRGPLLSESLFAGLFEAERATYRARALEMLHWLGDHYGRLMQQARAESAFTRAIALAPTDEASYLAYMRHYRAAGRPDRIRQLYWDYRKALKAHRNQAPAAAFEQAYQAIAA